MNIALSVALCAFAWLGASCAVLGFFSLAKQPDWLVGRTTAMNLVAIGSFAAGIILAALCLRALFSPLF